MGGKRWCWGDGISGEVFNYSIVAVADKWRLIITLKKKGIVKGF